jgi:hypothetical protein
MPTFADENIVERAPRRTLWREPGFLFVKLLGDIDDEHSVAWRRAVDAHTAACGWPPFMALDVSEALAVNSMSMRLQSAAWARNTLRHIEDGTIYTAGNQRSSFVIKTVLRVAGMPNVHVVSDAAVFEEACARYRTGAASAGT